MAKEAESEIKFLERFINSSLTPVKPRPEFVEQLHQRLTDPMLPTVRVPRPATISYVLLVLASVVSGIVFFVTASQVVKSLVRRYWGA